MVADTARFGSLILEVVQGDITRQPDMDAIVNAANAQLAPGAGVCGAIHRAAGPGLAAACREIGGCPTGEARITPGFKLPARWIIHTVGPVWHGGGSGEAEKLRSAYRSSLELARERGIKSIAFPGISTGVYGYPKEEAARVGLTVMREYEDKFDEIIACCFSAGDRALYEKLLTG